MRRGDVTLMREEHLPEHHPHVHVHACITHSEPFHEKLAKLRAMHRRGKKLTVGVYGLTGCAGCQLTILFAKDKLFRFLTMVDVMALPFIKEQNYTGNFDIIILEGLVANKEDKERAEELRRRCGILVCIGACAVHGCVPAMKNFMNNPEVERAVYAKVDYLNSLAATPVSKHVPVDLELPGCPPDENQIYAVLTDLVLGRPPRVTHNPVCVECVHREVDCLLMQGKPCLGPITTGGCDAICTAAGHECMGCRGPAPDANLTAFINLLERQGQKRENIERRLKTYAALAMDEAEKAQDVQVNF
ncbi:oxidoreductase [Candidatus Woesearchaeota archaeon]|nr:MAG: oxidoreductase [Candidatus Woesearchaeota archaeon]